MSIALLDRQKVTSCLKLKGKSRNYKYVYRYESPFGEIKWRMQVRKRAINNSIVSKYYDSEKEAAKAVDILLIRHNMKPVNILIPSAVREPLKRAQ